MPSFEELRNMSPEEKKRVKVVILEGTKGHMIEAHPFYSKEAAKKARVRIIDEGHIAIVRTRTTGEKYKQRTYKPKASEGRDIGGGIVREHGRQHLRLY